MFYCLYVFSKDIYYHEKENAVIICQRENTKLIIHDLYVKSKEDISGIISCHLEGIENISYGFEIDIDNIIPYEDKESNLFVRTKETDLLKEWYYPTNSIT